MVDQFLDELRWHTLDVTGPGHAGDQKILVVVTDHLRFFGIEQVVEPDVRRDDLGACEQANPCLMHGGLAVRLDHVGGHGEDRGSCGITAEAPDPAGGLDPVGRDGVVRRAPEQLDVVVSAAAAPNPPKELDEDRILLPLHLVELDAPLHAVGPAPGLEAELLALATTADRR